MKVIDKRSKKQKKADAKKMRVLVPFNTGTRIHKGKKELADKALKKELRDFKQGNHRDDDSPLFFARPPHAPALDFLKIFYYNKFVKK